jgi:hypothetical protein
MGVCKLLLGRVDDFSLEGGEPSVPKGVCMGGGVREQVKTLVASCKVSMSVPPCMRKVGAH